MASTRVAEARRSCSAVRLQAFKTPEKSRKGIKSKSQEWEEEVDIHYAVGECCTLSSACSKASDSYMIGFGKLIAGRIHVAERVKISAPQLGSLPYKVCPDRFSISYPSVSNGKQQSSSLATRA